MISFLSLRRLELSSSKNDTITSFTFDGAPTDLLKTLENVESMESIAKTILKSISNPKIQDLMMIRDSPRYVERVAEKLKQLLTDAEKMTAMSHLMVQNRNEAIEEEKKLLPKLDTIKKRTFELRDQVAKEVSSRYKNRRVNILGEINAI